MTITARVNVGETFRRARHGLAFPDPRSLEKP